eukprot:gene2995-3268_t
MEINSLENSNSLKKKEQILSRDAFEELIRSFTAYHLHFKTIDRIDSLTCHSADYYNLTQRFLDEGLNRCACPRCGVRRLERSHVSWTANPNTTNKKRKSSSSSSEEKDGNSSSNTNTTTTSNDKNISSTDNTSSVTKEERKESRIHEYLVFGLFLPDHPFSTEVHHLLNTVSSMFPHITMVHGNGYDFRDMVQKYSVQSFPKLILFRHGLYLDEYSGDYTAPALASYLAVWTKRFPKTYPRLLSPPAPLPSYRLLPIPSPFFFNYSDPYGIIEKIKQSKGLLLPYPNLEPFIGSTREYAFWDSTVLLLSAIYCLVRLVFLCRSSRRGDRLV